MAELPEIKKLSEQMNSTLQGKIIQQLTVNQEKCLNTTTSEFQNRITGSTISTVHHKGKWIFIKLDKAENILPSLGMGAEVHYFDPADTLPEKYQIKLDFTDGTGFTVSFWWFGKFFVSSDKAILSEPSTKDIALDPFDKAFTLDYFKQLTAGKRTQVKPFLLNQKNVSGIGNMYIHDILFRAKIHPKRKLSELTEDEKAQLYEAIQTTLNDSVQKGTFSYETDFFGNKGGWDDFLIGYQEDENCPACQKTKIVSLKTGSIKSYLCPSCQPI